MKIGKKVEGLSKTEFKELSPIATKESCFIFNEKLYKQVEEVPMSAPLGPTQANAFLAHFEKNWLQNRRSDYKPFYYRRYVGYVFVLFTLPKLLEKIQKFSK